MTIDSLTAQLETLTQTGIDGMTDAQIIEHRKQILALAKQCSKALGQTSTKERVTITDADVKLYINKILTDGYNLAQTKLSADKQFTEAQHVVWWKHIIKDCVQHSVFADAVFHVKELSVQRSDIEQACTLHDLRQAVKAIIGPLKLYRELTQEPDAIEYALTTEDMLIVENEQLRLELLECKRVLSEITNLYNDSLLHKRDKQQIVDDVQAFKVEHSCNDDEACRVFNISRSTLKRMRNELLEDCTGS